MEDAKSEALFPAQVGPLLPAKQEEFLSAYLSCGIGTEAVRAVWPEECEQIGPSAVSERARSLLRSPRIKSRLEELKEARAIDIAAKYAPTRDRVMGVLSAQAFTVFPDVVRYGDGDMTIKDFAELSPEQKVCIQSFTINKKTGAVKVELYDSNKAANDLAKYMGMDKSVPTNTIPSLHIHLGGTDTAPAPPQPMKPAVPVAEAVAALVAAPVTVPGAPSLVAMDGDGDGEDG